MPIIKPISDLRNKSNEISELAHNLNEPIFITKNGEGNLVVMSISHFSNMQLKLELLAKLSIAQNQRVEGDTGRTLKQVMTNIRKSINVN
ncbi:MAG: type II toxin-antitoxin system prevent-host-death family antitoxin [Melioribacteraceae bacterium]|jgi:prevent-host-death family protein|nr:type II toxin-antitoxin system prevent-host-death family antitoxin [Melioribacteraceae bacterium]